MAEIVFTGYAGDEVIPEEDSVIVQVAQLSIKLADDSTVDFDVYVGSDDHQKVYIESDDVMMRMEGGPNVWETFREFLPLGCSMDDFYFDHIVSDTMGELAESDNLLDMSWTLVKRHHDLIQIQMLYEHGI
jgi:hypothetical protein